MAIVNNAFVYCTGPVEVFVRFPSGLYNAISWSDPTASSSGIVYLGTCEQNPETDDQPQFKPVFTAQGGDMVPFDQIQMGTILSVNLDLARFNQEVLSAVQNAARKTSRGNEFIGERGKLLLAQNGAFEMWLYNSFYPQAILAGNALYPDMSPGMYIPACKVQRVYKSRDGVSQSKAMVSVQAQPIWRATTRSFFTYSENPDLFVAFTSNTVQPG